MTLLVNVEHYQRRTLLGKSSYKMQTRLTKECQKDLIRWMKHLELNIGKPISIATPDLIIQLDVAKVRDLGACFQGLRT